MQYLSIFIFHVPLLYPLPWYENKKEHIIFGTPSPKWKSMIRPWSRATLPCILPCITTLELPGPFSGPWIPAASEFPARNIIDAISVHIYFSCTPSLPFAMIWKQKGAHNLWQPLPQMKIHDSPLKSSHIALHWVAGSERFDELRSSFGIITASTLIVAMPVQDSRLMNYAYL